MEPVTLEYLPAWQAVHSVAPVMPEKYPAEHAVHVLEPAILTVHAAGGRAMLENAKAAAGVNTKVVAVTVLTSLDDGDLLDIGVGGRAEDQVARSREQARPAAGALYPARFPQAHALPVKLPAVIFVAVALGAELLALVEPEPRLGEHELVEGLGVHAEAAAVHPGEVERVGRQYPYP